MNILAGHLLGDILLQNKWLARLKRRTWLGLALHCTITTITMCVFTGWWDWRIMLVFGSHLAIDGLALGKRVWPNFIKQGNPDTDDVAPAWLGLFDDQALHLICYTLIGRIV